MDDRELIGKFHAMWDGFPGMARLITDEHVVLAANDSARERGFADGAICAKVGDPAIHRQCKLAKMFETGQAQTDCFIPDRIRGWVPVKGRDDVCVHFALPVPEQ